VNALLPSPEQPRAMAREDVRRARAMLLDAPHVAPLTEYVARLRESWGGFVPDFDPLDGGVHAKALFLMEKPGPMTDAEGVRRVGSGFISRDNDDPTAEAIFHFMAAAGWDRRDTLLWNTVPSWNGTRAIKAGELRAGAAALSDLRQLLPGLKAVVLVGARAAQATKLLQDWDVPLFVSDHPSPINRAARPERWRQIPEIWKEARLSVDDAGTEALA